MLIEKWWFKRYLASVGEKIPRPFRVLNMVLQSGKMMSSEYWEILILHSRRRFPFQSTITKEVCEGSSASCESLFLLLCSQYTAQAYVKGQERYEYKKDLKKKSQIMTSSFSYRASSPSLSVVYQRFRAYPIVASIFVAISRSLSFLR